MSTRHKILLVDDEQDALDLYRSSLESLSSKPEIHVSNSGARAMALLESEPFDLLISDLNMPKMDGLQVISIVKRKFPQLRIVVLTAVVDEHYRSRAYALGVDLYWAKPANAEELKQFQDCIESLLGKEDEAGGGFRGVQRKSLMDIVQLECLSNSSSVLKITNGRLEGKIWILDGSVVDAVVDNENGEDAFKKIFAWRTGNFEILPAEPDHPRTIHNTYQSLLLDSAQSLDESLGAEAAQAGADDNQPSKLAQLARTPGVEFLLVIRSEKDKPLELWGLESSESMATWLRQTQTALQDMAFKLQWGELEAIECIGHQRHLAVRPISGASLCAGFTRSFTSDQVRETMKSLVNKWAS